MFCGSSLRCPGGGGGCLQCVIVVFHDHIPLLFFRIILTDQNAGMRFQSIKCNITLVNVYVDLLVFTRIAGTS